MRKPSATRSTSSSSSRWMAALLRHDSTRCPPRRLPVRVHRADEKPIRLDGDSRLALRAPPGGGNDGQGARETRHAREALRLGDSESQDGARETPWLRQRAGEQEKTRRSSACSILHVSRAIAEALAKLKKAHLPSGRSPGSGRPAVPYMTLYLLAGFARSPNSARDPRGTSWRKAAVTAGEIERDWWKRL